MKGYEEALSVGVGCREERTDNRREFTIKKECDGKQIIECNTCMR